MNSSAHTFSRAEFQRDMDILEAEIAGMSDEDIAKQLYEKGMKPCDDDYLIKLGIIDNECVAEPLASREHGGLFRYSAATLRCIKAYFLSWPISALAVTAALAMGLVVQTATVTTLSAKNESIPAPTQVAYNPDSLQENVSTAKTPTQTIYQKQWGVVKGASNELYPIYQSPKASSALLAQVKSGTNLEIMWFQIKTEKGLGYMSTEDFAFCNSGLVADC